MYLKTRVYSIVNFYTSFSYSPVKEVVSYPSVHVSGVDLFLDSFVNNYTNNEEFCSSFLTSLCKAYVAKVDGVTNPKYGTEVQNFLLALSKTGNKSSFEFVLGNLYSV